MVRVWLLAVRIAALALLMVGCAQGVGDAPAGSTGPTSAPGTADGTTTEETTTTSVPPDRRQAQDPPPRAPEKQAGLFFPRMPAGPRGVILEALGDGRLFVENGCIYMGPTERRYRDEVPSDVVVWPHGYSLSRKNGEVLILDEKDKVVARVGETVSMGGGEIRREDSGGQFEERRGELGVPDRCRGPLWLSSGVITKPEK